MTRRTRAATETRTARSTKTARRTRSTTPRRAAGRRADRALLRRGGPVVALLTGVVVLILVIAGGVGLPSAPSTQIGFAPSTQIGFAPDARTPSACAAEDLDCLAQAYGNIAFVDGPSAAFAAIAADDRGDIALSCHRIVHRIGAAALARDPERPGVAIAAGQSDCSSGYYHGVMQHVFLGLEEQTATAIASAGAEICNDPLIRRERFTQMNCLHGIGHGALIVTEYDLADGLAICAAISDPWSREWCYSGVYMENVLPAYGTTSVWIDEQDPAFPCTAVTDAQGKGSCYQSLAISALTASGGDFAGPATACAAAESAYRFICYAAMGSQVNLAASATEIAAACGLAGDYLPTCIYGALRFQSSQDGTLAVGAARCADPAIGIDRATCLRAIGSGLVGLVTGPQEVERACRAALPVATDYELCLRGATGERE